MDHFKHVVAVCVLLTSSSILLGEEGLELFNLNCSPCHGKDGKARTPIARKLGVKDLTQSKISDDEILRQIRDGRKGPEGKLQMPAFGEKFTIEQIKQLIPVVKRFRK